MAPQTTPKNTPHNRFTAILIVVLFAAGGLGAIDAQATHAGGHTVQTDATAYRGLGDIVTFSFEDDQVDEETTKQVQLRVGTQNVAQVQAKLASTPGAAGDERWVGQFRIGEDTPTDNDHIPTANLGGGTTAVTFKILHPDSGDSGDLTWTPKATLAVVKPTATQTKVLHGSAAISVEIRDADLKVTSANDATCTFGAGSEAPTFLKRINGGAWSIVAPGPCTTKAATNHHVAYRLTGLGTGLTESDTLTLRIVDTNNADGRQAVHDLVYRFKEAASGAFRVFESDHRTEVTGTGPLKGINAQYVLRVQDPDANSDPNAIDRIPVRATSERTSGAQFHQTDLVLRETGVDTSEFQLLFQVATTPVTNGILVDDSGNMRIVFSYADNRSASGAKITVTKTLDWNPTRSGTITLADREGRSTPSLLSVFGRSQTTGVPATFNPSTHDGSFIRVTLNDDDEPTTPKIVIRSIELLASECTAADLAAAEASTDPRCRVLTLSGSGPSYIGYVLFVAPGSGAVPGSNWAPLPIVNGGAFVVEYLDASASSGSRNIVVGGTHTTLVWFESFDGQLSLDKDAYYVGETMTIRLVDPDQRGSSPKTVRVRTDRGLDQTVTLTETTDAGTFSGTVKVGTGAGELPATDGDKVDVEYGDPLDATGAARTTTPIKLSDGGRKAAILEDRTGRVLWNTTVARGTAPLKLTLEDTNADGSTAPPTALLDIPFAPTPKDRAHFTALNAVAYEANIRSEIERLTTSAIPSLVSDGGDHEDEHPGLGECYYQITIGEPIQPGVTVREGTNVWTPRLDVTPTTNTDRTIQVDYNDGVLLIDSSEKSPVPGAACPSRNSVQDKTFAVTYTPAAKVTEQFLGDGATKRFFVGRFSDITRADLMVSANADLPALAGGLSLEGFGFPAFMTDTTPALDGSTTDDPLSTTAAFHRLHFKGDPADAAAPFDQTSCSWVTVEVAGTTIRCLSIDSTNAVIEANVPPGVNQVVNITYYVSGVVTEGTAATTDLTFGPVVAAALVGSDQSFLQAQASGNPYTTNDIQDIVDNGDLIGDESGESITCPCTYQTEVYHNNRATYGEAFAHDQDRVVKASYVDSVPASGTTTTIDAFVGYAPSGGASLDLKDGLDRTTRYIFGTKTAALIKLTHGGANLNPVGLDTVTLNIESFPVNAAATGSRIEADSITLIETGPNTNLFTGRLALETAGVPNNGKINVGTHDQVTITLDYAAGNLDTRAWYFQTVPGTLSVAGPTELVGPNARAAVSVTDGDAGNRYVSWFSTETLARAEKDQKVTLPPAFVPGLVDSVIVWSCPAATAADPHDCVQLGKASGNPDTTPVPPATFVVPAGKFFVRESTGTLKMSDHRSGTSSDASERRIRVDVRAAHVDETTISVEILDDRGQVIPSRAGTLQLKETGAKTNTFFANIPLCPEGQVGCSYIQGKVPVNDRETVRFSYLDRNFHAIGNPAGGAGTAGCNAPVFVEVVVSGDPTLCPFGKERDSSRQAQLRATVTWRTSTPGTLALETNRAAITSTAGFPPGSTGHVHGTELVTVTVTDADADVGSNVQDTVTVVLEKEDGSTESFQVFETGANTGIFSKDIALTDVLPFGRNDRFNIRYDDATGLAGTPVTVKLTDHSTVNRDDLRWLPASDATVLVDRESARLGGAVTVTIEDADRNAETDQVETIDEDSIRLVVSDRRDRHRAAGTTLSDTVRDTVAADLSETDPASGEFTSTWTLDPTALAGHGGKWLHVIYTDPTDRNGRAAEASASIFLAPADAGVPRFSQRIFESQEALVSVTVIDPDAPGTTLPVEIRVGSLSETGVELELDSTAASTFTGIFSLQERSGTTSIEVDFDERFFVVYADAASAIGPQVLIDEARLVRSDRPVESVADIISGTPGKRGWYTTAPTIEFTATKNPGRLDHFEYRFDEGATYTECPAPCTVTVSDEGEHSLRYRAVDFGGIPEEEQTLDVKFDATAPAASVQNLTATSVKDGGIQLDFVSPVDLDDPLQFGSFLIYQGTTATQVDNGTEPSHIYVPDEDGTYTLLVAIEDAAGNVDTSLAVSVEGAVSDRVAPQLLRAGVLEATIIEGEGSLDANLYALLAGAAPSDFDQVIAAVTPPAGGVASEVPLTASGANNYTAIFSGFNVTGLWSFEFRALDNAGNFAPISDTVFFQGIDRTPPTVSVPTQVERGESLTVTVEDNDAGIASISYRVDGGASVPVTVPAAGITLEITFDVPTASLALGDHQITVEAADKNATANRATVTRTFEVVAPGSLGDDDEVVDDATEDPGVELLTDLAELDGRLRVRIDSPALTVLTVAFDGGAPRSVIASWTAATGVVDVSLSGLAEGEHTANIVATNAAGTTTQEVTFYVLPSGVPLPPTFFVKVTAEGHTEVSWTSSPSANVGGYLVHRASSPWRVIAVLGPDATRFVDRDVESDTDYQYKVTAYGANGEGRLDEGADSEELSFFSRVQGTDVTVEDTGSFFANYWWVFLVLLAVAGAVVAVYVYRDRLFAPRGEDDTDYGEYPDEADDAPFGAPSHDLRCPNCTHEFAVTGEKPIVTTCPNCGKKGILR